MDDLVYEIRCLDCSWRYLVSDLTVRECYIDPLDFHEREHSRDTSKVGRAHLHFARTRRAFTDG